MPSQDNAYLRHQQKRWLRPDAHRWVRPDAARFLKLGTRVEDVFPALALKYSASQPRVPAGNGIDSGRWTDGGGARMQIIIDTTDLENRDIGDASDEIGSLGMFEITPREPGPGGVQLAGDLPSIGDNGGPPLDEPPKIPSKLQETSEQRMGFVRDAARWLAKVGRGSALADAFFGAAEQVEEINRLTDMIRTANDPPETLKVLQGRVTGESEKGYDDHHIVGQHDGNREKFGDAHLDSPENQVRIPRLKHLDINGWYSRPSDDFGGLSPRDFLRDKDWDEQMRLGLKVLRDRGILKP